MDNPIYIVIGPQVWGRANTAQAALKNARREYGPGLKDYDVYEAHPDSTVDELGRISYPIIGVGRLDNIPSVIKKVRKGKELPLS